MKICPFLLSTVVVVATLAGCSSDGTKLARASEAFAECTLAQKSNCDATLEDGTQLTAKRATLFANDDSIRVTAVAQRDVDCMWFGSEAGKARNTSVTINDITVKMYGDELDGAVTRACEGPGPHRVAVTVAKQV